MLKQLPRSGMDFLLHIFNLSWSSHSFPSIWKTSSIIPLHKMRKPLDSPAIKDKKKQTFHNILDNIIVQLKSRFENFSELSFLGLVDWSKFSEMAPEFDDTKLRSLSEKYAKFFDSVKLKADLIGLYSSQTVRNERKTPAQLLSFLYQNDLIQSSDSSVGDKVTEASAHSTRYNIIGGKIFSALKSIKTYNGNQIQEKRPLSLAIIAIEKERLQKLRQNKEDFYNNFIDIFVQKDRRMDFIFK